MKDLESCKIIFRKTAGLGVFGDFSLQIIGSPLTACPSLLNSIFVVVQERSLPLRQLTLVSEFRPPFCNQAQAFARMDLLTSGVFLGQTQDSALWKGMFSSLDTSTYSEQCLYCG